MCTHFGVVFVTFPHSTKRVDAVHTVGEGRLTDKEPNENRRKTSKEQEPYEDPDQDGCFRFGRLLLSAG